MTAQPITKFKLAWNHSRQIGGLIPETSDGEETELAFRMTEFSTVATLMSYPDITYDKENGVIMTDLITP